MTVPFRPNLALLLVSLLLANEVAAQAIPNHLPFVIPFQIPSTLGRARLRDSAFVGDAISYHYTGPKITSFDVYVWPTSLAEGVSPKSQDSLLQLEVTKFKEVAPLGIERGWYDNYQIAFADPHPVAINGDSVPGYVVALVFARHSEQFASFFYIYPVHQMFVKIRLTVPAADWGTNPALDLPAELIRALARPR